MGKMKNVKCPRCKKKKVVTTGYSSKNSYKCNDCMWEGKFDDLVITK